MIMTIRTSSKNQMLVIKTESVNRRRTSWCWMNKIQSYGSILSYDSVPIQLDVLRFWILVIIHFLWRLLSLLKHHQQYTKTYIFTELIDMHRIIKRRRDQQQTRRREFQMSNTLVNHINSPYSYLFAIMSLKEVDTRFDIEDMNMSRKSTNSQIVALRMNSQSGDIISRNKIESNGFARISNGQQEWNILSTKLPHTNGIITIASEKKVVFGMPSTACDIKQMIGQ